MSGLLGTKAIWCCCVSLLVSFVMMFVPEKRITHLLRFPLAEKL